MCKELSIFNVKELKHGDIVFIKDPETGEDVDLIVEIQKFNNKIYLTTLDSDLDGYDNNKDTNGEMGNYGDYICHFRTRLAPHENAAAMTRDHLIFTLMSGKFEIDKKGSK
jgi:hypothetical protein